MTQVPSCPECHFTGDDKPTPATKAGELFFWFDMYRDLIDKAETGGLAVEYVNLDEMRKAVDFMEQGFIETILHVEDETAHQAIANLLMYAMGFTSILESALNIKLTVRGFENICAVQKGGVVGGASKKQKAAQKHAVWQKMIDERYAEDQPPQSFNQACTDVAKRCAARYAAAAATYQKAISEGVSQPNEPLDIRGSWLTIRDAVTNPIAKSRKRQ